VRPAGRLLQCFDRYKCLLATEATAVLKQMFANGCDPNIMTFNTIISAFCQEGDVRQALQLLREAIRRELEPN
jgi:pentatricopeptide repeat protein